tara:strand:- start:489 stop:1118 length:630 start_codon:yes stop_codon:yes gene_type:complete
VQKFNNVILVGYSGHAIVLADMIIEEGGKIIGYTEKVAVKNNPFSLKYLGLEQSKEFKYFNSKYNFVVGIGDNITRMKITSFLRTKNQNIISIVHPSSSISKTAKLGSGIFISRNVSVNNHCEIGDDVIINTSSSIDHECKIFQGAHIAPGAVLCGNVQVGTGTFVGANAIIKEGVKIGDYVKIGAGSVVLKNIGNNALIVGNPGKLVG